MDKKQKTGTVYKVNKWINKTGAGKEKIIIPILLVIAFATMGLMIYRKVTTPENERVTIGDVLDDFKAPVLEGNGVTISDAIENYKLMEKDEKALELIQQLQLEIRKPELDTVYIMELQRELSKMNIHLTK